MWIYKLKNQPVFVVGRAVKRLYKSQLVQLARQDRRIANGGRVFTEENYIEW